jgi:hypothetical protein
VLEGCSQEVVQIEDAYRPSSQRPATMMAIRITEEQVGDSGGAGQ